MLISAPAPVEFVHLGHPFAIGFVPDRNGLQVRLRDLEGIFPGGHRFSAKDLRRAEKQGYDMPAVAASAIRRQIEAMGPEQLAELLSSRRELPPGERPLTPEEAERLRAVKWARPRRSFGHHNHAFRIDALVIPQGVAIWLRDRRDVFDNATILLEADLEAAHRQGRNLVAEGIQSMEDAVTRLSEAELRDFVANFPRLQDE